MRFRKLYERLWDTKRLDGKNIFDITSADTEEYQKYLDNPEETNKRLNTTSSIEYLTPREYLEQSAKLTSNNSINNLILNIKSEQDRINNVKKVLEVDKKMLPITYINYATNKQEGNHRMYVVGNKYGWDKEHPVLIIKPTERFFQVTKNEDMKDELNIEIKQLLRNHCYLTTEDFILTLRETIKDNIKNGEIENPEILNFKVVDNDNYYKLYIDSKTYIEIDKQDISICNMPDDYEDDERDLTPREKKLLGID